MVAMDIQPVHLTKNIVYAASFDLTKNGKYLSNK